MRKYKDLTEVEKQKIINYIIDVWEHGRAVTVIISDTHFKIRLTQPMLRDAIKREFGVEIGQLTLHRIISKYFEPREPKVFKPRSLEA